MRDNGGYDKNQRHKQDRPGEYFREIAAVVHGIMHDDGIEYRNEEYFDHHPGKVL